jgi:hypothetical protein
MKTGDLVRLRKSHPAVKTWRHQPHLFIGRWAEEGAPLLILRRSDYDDERWEVLGPGGQLASFDYWLLTTRGMK